MGSQPRSVIVMNSVKIDSYQYKVQNARDKYIYV